MIPLKATKSLTKLISSSHINLFLEQYLSGSGESFPAPPGACICMSPLSAAWQAINMSNPSVALNAHQPSHISLNTLFQIISDEILGEQFTNGIEFSLAKVLDEFVLDAELGDDVLRLGTAYSVEVLKSVHQTLVVRDLASHTASDVYVLHAHTVNLQKNNNCEALWNVRERKP